MTKLKANLEFNNRQALDMVLQVSATHPSNPTAGKIYYGSANIAGPPTDYHEKHIRYYDGTVWQELATRAWVEDNFGGIAGYTSWWMNTANHATTPTPFSVIDGAKIAFIGGTDINTVIANPGGWASRTLTINHDTYSAPSNTTNDSSSHISSITVSNGHITAHNTVARSVRWSTGSTTQNNIPYWSATGGVLHNVGYSVVKSTPTGITSPGSDSAVVTEAALVAYVKNHVHGLNGKASARVASTGNINLSNPGTSNFDGITLTSGQRILVKNQSTASQNGIYVFNGSSSAMTRSDDANTWDELVSAYIFIEEGTTQEDTGWLCTVDIGGTLGTTAVTWEKFFHFGETTAANLGTGEAVYESKEGNELRFRSFTAANAAGTALSVALAGSGNVHIAYTFTPSAVNLDEFGGTLSATKGGTGLSSYATGDILYASNSTTLARRAVGTNGHVLTLVSGLPQWQDPGTLSGAITDVDNNLFCGAINVTTLRLWACTARTNDRFYRNADNPNAANTGLKYAGDFHAYNMTAWNNLFIKEVPDLGISSAEDTYLFAGVLPTGGNPWQLRKMTLLSVLQEQNVSEHYFIEITGTSGLIEQTAHKCGLRPMVVIRERSGTSPNFTYRDVLCNIVVNASGDITWSVDDAFTAGNPGLVIVIGAKVTRTTT